MENAVMEKETIEKSESKEDTIHQNGRFKKILQSLANNLRGISEAKKELKHEAERKHLKKRQKCHIKKTRAIHHQYKKQQEQKKQKDLSSTRN